VHTLNISNLCGSSLMSFGSSSTERLALTFSNQFVLSIECFWRLLKKDVIVLTSGDEGQMFGHSQPVNALDRLQTSLASAQITQAIVIPGTCDIHLFFDNDQKLEVIVDSSGYEAWQLTGPDNSMTIAQGGGNIVVLPANA
jgi:hypothetical protein